MEEKPIKSGEKTDRDEKTGKFLPGNNANPSGRPLGSISIVTRLKKIFEEDPDRFENYCNEILKDPKMKRDVMEQIDGRPRQAVEVSGDGLPFILKIIRDDGDNENKREDS